VGRVNLLSSEKKVGEDGEVWEVWEGTVGSLGGVGRKSTFIHAAWDTPRPYLPHPPHPPYPPHPLPKYFLGTKNEQWGSVGRDVA